MCSMFFFSSRRRHTRYWRDWSSDVCSSDLVAEFVRVLERYCVGIGVRTFARLKNWEEERIDPVLHAFARYASVPIINLEIGRGSGRGRGENLVGHRPVKKKKHARY